MPYFSYTAADPQDRATSGELEAASRQAATRELQNQGLRPVTVRERKSETGLRANDALFSDGPIGRSERYTSRERLPFLKALHALVSGGYPVGEALRLLPRRMHDRKLQSLSLALWERLSAGATFSRALQDFPETFDGQSINLIRAGEATGNVREVLRRLIQHYTTLGQLRRRIFAALCYPVFICLVATAVLLFFAMFLMPRLQGLLHSLGGSLPFATRLLLAASHGLVVYGPFVAVAAALAVIGLCQWWKTSSGRETIDALILRLPVVGSLAIDASVQNFCQTLAVLLENGVILVEALRIAERTIPNRVLSRGFRQAADAVVEGQSVTSALSRIPSLPLALIDRFSLGENTGQLAPHLRDLATELEEQLTHHLKSVTDLLSTAVLLFAFAFVGFVAYAVVSAVFQVSASFKF